MEAHLLQRHGNLQLFIIKWFQIKKHLTLRHWRTNSKSIKTKKSSN